MGPCTTWRVLSFGLVVTPCYLLDRPKNSIIPAYFLGDFCALISVCQRQNLQYGSEQRDT